MDQQTIPFAESFNLGPESVDIFTALDLILKEKEHPIDINVPPTASVPVISDAN